MAGAAAREGDDTAARGQSAHSGRLLLRMPRNLHAQLAEAAEREGVSLNQLIVGTLSRSVNGVAHTDGEPGREPAPPAREPRFLTVALVVNLVVILVAGIVAVALLVAAWRGGF
jgi:RNA polymerase sigma-B factor